MEVTFVELADGRLLNLFNVVKFNPNLSNRIDYANGAHELLSAEDAEAFRRATKPQKTQRRGTAQK